MEILAEQLGIGEEWSNLTKLQKDTLEKAQHRYVPVVHSEGLLRHWYSAKRFVFTTSNDWKLFYQLEGTNKYRLICSYDPKNLEISWWVGRLQFRPIEKPEIHKLPLELLSN